MRGIQELCEAVGGFTDGDSMHEAIDELICSGFDFGDLGLLASERTVRQTVGEFYVYLDGSVGMQGTPGVAFVPNQSMGDTVHSQLGNLFAIGATLDSGAMVCSTAVFGGMLGLRLKHHDLPGSSFTAPSVNMHPLDADELEKQVDKGHLLLFVRTWDADEEDSAVSILSKSGAHDARIYRAALIHSYALAASG